MFNTDKSKEASQNKVSGLMSGAAGIGIGVGSSLLNSALYGSPKYQQQQMQDMQIKGAKELADYNYQKQLDMWKATGPAEMRKQLEDAGYSPALMYGGSGAGGGTTGSGGGGMPTGDTGSAQMMARIQAQAMNADTVLKLATAEKTKAETENISGVEKDLKGEELKHKIFDNNVRDLVTEKASADAIKWANDKIQIDSEKANADWEAYKAGAFDGKAYDDKNSPVAKAMNAGFNNAVEELKQTRLENNAKEAENIVKRFEARMAEQGIHPNSPWYVKLIGDLLEKAGITTVIKAGAKAMGGK